MSHDAKCRECGTFLEATPSGFACPKMCGKIWPKHLASELAQQQVCVATKIECKKARYEIKGYDGAFMKCRKRAGCVRAWIGEKRFWLTVDPAMQNAVEAQGA